jgi:hypothetical protein
MQLRVGSNFIIQLTSTGISFGADASFDNNNHVLNVQDNNGGSAVGKTFRVQGQTVTGGGGAVGGATTFAAGDATNTAGGVGGACTVRGGDSTGASGTRTGGNCTMRPGSGASGNGVLDLQNGAGISRVKVNDTGIGFYAAAPVAQATVTGSRGGNAALADLLTKLANLGLIVDGTSA